MYYSVIGILAAMILLIENQDILWHPSDAFEQPAWRVYRRFLFAVLAYYVTDILWGLLAYQKLTGLLFADTSVYYVAMAVGIWHWTQYTVAYLHEKGTFERMLLYAGRILAGLVTALVVVNVFVPVLFVIDADCNYHALLLRDVDLCVQIMLLFAISGYAFSAILHRTCPEWQARRYRTLGLFGLIMAVFLCVQLWFPLLPLYTIAYMLGTCLLRAFVVGNEKEEYRRDLAEAAKVVELKQSITSLLDNMPGMTFSKDAKTGVYLACNQPFADYVHKASPADVVGLTDEQIFDPEAAKQFAEADHIALAMDEPYIFFEDVPDAAGNQRQLQTTKLRFIDTAGRSCVLGICQDITDIVRIQHEYVLTKDAYEQAQSTGIIYSHIAQALARGYTDLYYINLDTEEYIEYHTDSGGSTLTEARRGQHFFEECEEDASRLVYADDREAFVRAMKRQTLLDALERNDTFSMTYRQTGENGPTYVSMKVSRMEDDERFIVLGVTDVDEQTKRRRIEERMREERVAYTRLNALSGDYLSIHLVDPETGRYREYSTATSMDSPAAHRTGMDFFADAREVGNAVVHPDDLARYLSLFTRECVLAETENGGVFALTFRLLLRDEPMFVQLKAAIVDETEGRRLVVGINDIDSLVRREEDYERRLAQAQSKANLDALTGVKNKHAYLSAEAQLNRRIEEHHSMEFVIVILDINDLKNVNDTLGHQAGDQYIRDACKFVCNTFKHSPVFRVGGDEFAVISQGSDYATIDELVKMVSAHNVEALRSGGVVVACGMAKYDNDPSVASVFERADLNMYENKSALKDMEA